MDGLNRRLRAVSRAAELARSFSYYIASNGTRNPCYVFARRAVLEC